MLTEKQKEQIKKLDKLYLKKIYDLIVKYMEDQEWIEYEYKPELAPSKELLSRYKDKIINWEEYIKVYNKLLIDRNILKDISIDDLDNIVLLCSEPTAEQCHRRLMAEYLAKHFENIKIGHL